MKTYQTKPQDSSKKIAGTATADEVMYLGGNHGAFKKAAGCCNLENGFTNPYDPEASHALWLASAEDVQVENPDPTGSWGLYAEWIA